MLETMEEEPEPVIAKGFAFFGVQPSSKKKIKPVCSPIVNRKGFGTGFFNSVLEVRPSMRKNSCVSKMSVSSQLSCEQLVDCLSCSMIRVIVGHQPWVPILLKCIEHCTLLPGEVFHCIHYTKVCFIDMMTISPISKSVKTTNY